MAKSQKTLTEKRRKKIKLNYWGTLLLGLITLTASWMLGSLMSESITMLLASFGVDSTYAQTGIVLFVVILFWVALGFSLKRAINKVAG